MRVAVQPPMLPTSGRSVVTSPSRILMVSSAKGSGAASSAGGGSAGPRTSGSLQAARPRVIHQILITPPRGRLRSSRSGCLSNGWASRWGAWAVDGWGGDVSMWVGPGLPKVCRGGLGDPSSPRPHFLRGCAGEPPLSFAPSPSASCGSTTLAWGWSAPPCPPGPGSWWPTTPAASSIRWCCSSRWGSGWGFWPRPRCSRTRPGASPWRRSTRLPWRGATMAAGPTPIGSKTTPPSPPAGRGWPRGSHLALFPEGISHPGPELAPLRTGAARIALSAVAEGTEVLHIVPVGLLYGHRQTFRSPVSALVGGAHRCGGVLPHPRRRRGGRARA
jgi:hypothetical protein